MIHPLASLQGLQPCVLLDGAVFAKTRRGGGSATLLTARNVRHELRRLCPRQTLLKHHLRFAAPAFTELVHAEIRRGRAPSWLDTLRYLVDYLVPAFKQRDWGLEEDQPQPPAFDRPRDARPSDPPDPTAELVALAKEVPYPELPSPSYWARGRVWRLRATSPSPGQLRVVFDGLTLGLTGNPVAFGTLDKQWRQAVRKYVVDAVGKLIEVGAEQSAALAAARRSVSRAGFWESGEWLFLPGSPDRLGYVLPPHYSHTIGAASDRDLAITAMLKLPEPAVSGLCAYRRRGDKWVPLSLPNGLCLGTPPRGRLPDSPGLALAAMLRWAAIQISTDGKFHEHD